MALKSSIEPDLPGLIVRPVESDYLFKRHVLGRPCVHPIECAPPRRLRLHPRSAAKAKRGRRAGCRPSARRREACAVGAIERELETIWGGMAKAFGKAGATRP